MTASVRERVLLASRVLFRLASRSWPERLRREMQAEVLECFARLSEETLNRSGVIGLAGLTVRGVIDLLRTGLAERRGSRQPAAPPRRLRPSRGRREMLQVSFENVRLVLRGLRHARSSSLLVVATLGLGIGVNAALLELGYRVLWRPLPFEHPEALVALYETADGEASASRGSVAPGNFEDWRASTSTLETVAAHVETSVNLTGEGEPERLRVFRTSGDFFSLLGVTPLLGRSYTEAEDTAGAPRVALLGYGIWQRRFGGERSVVGRTILLDDIPHEVLGVLPSTLGFPRRDAQLFLPLALDEEERSTRRSHYLDVIARLADGVPLSEARDEMRGIGRALAEAHPDTNANETVDVVPLQQDLVDASRSSILLVLGAVGAVLLIACVNVSNLLLARASTRRREAALRTALGATRSRLLGHFMTEAMVLALAGGALGAAVAGGMGSTFAVLVPSHLIAVDTTGFATVAAAFGLALVVGVAIGLVPAWQLSGAGHGLAEQGARGVSSSSRGGRARGALVVVEVALALVLLLAGGMMLRGFLFMIRESPGFNAEQVLTMRIELSSAKYEQAAAKVGFYRQLLEGVERRPSVVTAGFVTMLPLTFTGGQTGFEVEGVPEPEEDTYAYLRSTTPHYFRAIGASLLSGRTFEDREDVSTEKTAVVNATFARRFLGDAPLGKRLRIWGQSHTVVGVVNDIKETTLSRETEPTLYVSAYQRSFGFFDPRDLAVRARGDLEPLVESIRAEVWAIDPDQPVSSVQTMTSLVRGSVADERFRTAAVALFAGAALLLAATGIYGVLAFAVSQRTAEIGLRMALGAQGADVLRMVLIEGMTPVALGVALGLTAALAFARSLAALVYGVEVTDPLSIVLITATLGAVSLGACLIPSLRAVRIDPLEALREE